MLWLICYPYTNTKCVPTDCVCQNGSIRAVFASQKPVAHQFCGAKLLIFFDIRKFFCKMRVLGTCRNQKKVVILQRIPNLRQEP